MIVNTLDDAYKITGMKTVTCMPDGVYVEKATPEQIEAERKIKWGQIEAIREAKYTNGVKVGAYWFQTSLTARMRYMGAAALGAGFPGADWKTMSGDIARLTGTLAGQIMTAIATQDEKIFKAAQAHKDAMSAASDPSIYNYNVGWPETFGEYMET